MELENFKVFCTIGYKGKTVDIPSRIVSSLGEDKAVELVSKAILKDISVYCPDMKIVPSIGKEYREVVIDYAPPRREGSVSGFSVALFFDSKGASLQTDEQKKSEAMSIVKSVVKVNGYAVSCNSGIETVLQIKDPNLSHSTLCEFLDEMELTTWCEFPYENREDFRLFLDEPNTVNILYEAGIVSQGHLRSIEENGVDVINFYWIKEGV